MQSIKVNGYAMSFLEVGNGSPLVCIHGSLCDFRVWFPVLGPLSRRHKVVVVSLRHCFPDHWDGDGDTYSIAHHAADLIAFIQGYGTQPVSLMGHSRGGHLAFRVAQERPDLLRRLVLAEPGVDLDTSFGLKQAAAFSLGPVLAAAAAKLASGDIEAGLEEFIDALEGAGAWRSMPASSKQLARDNAMTLPAQMREKRRPVSIQDARSVGVPTLFLGGANSPETRLAVMDTLAKHVPNSRSISISQATHLMFAQSPLAFSDAVLQFLDEDTICP